MESFKLDDRVKVVGKNARGYVAYIGPIHFAEGTWFGVVLDEAKGRHNGSFEGQRYFKCARNHGVFVRECQLKKESSENLTRPSDVICSKPLYPNYLTYSSKLKSDKIRSKSRSRDPTAKQLSVSKQEPLRHEMRVLRAALAEKSTEVNRLVDENNELELKIRTTQDALQETTQKYTNALERIASLKDDLETKSKKINVLQCHLYLLKSKGLQPERKQSMMKNLRSIEKSITNLCHVRESDFKNSYTEGEQQESGCRSVDRIRTLELQNKVMFQGFQELRNYLKNKCDCQDLDSEINSMNGHIGSENALNCSLHSEYFESAIKQDTNSQSSFFDEQENDFKYGVNSLNVTECDDGMNQKTFQTPPKSIQKIDHVACDIQNQTQYLKDFSETNLPKNKTLKCLKSTEHHKNSIPFSKNDDLFNLNSAQHFQVQESCVPKKKLQLAKAKTFPNPEEDSELFLDPMVELKSLISHPLSNDKRGGDFSLDKIEIQQDGLNGTMLESTSVSASAASVDKNESPISTPKSRKVVISEENSFSNTKPKRRFDHSRVRQLEGKN